MKTRNMSSLFAHLDNCVLTSNYVELKGILYSIQDGVKRADFKKKKY